MISTNKLFDKIEDFNIDDIKSDGIVIRTGNKVLKFSLSEENTYTSVEEEIREEIKEKIKVALLNLKDYVSNEINEMKMIVSESKNQYEEKEKELQKKLREARIMPDVTEDHCRRGLSVISGPNGTTGWLVRTTYWPRFVDGKRIEPAYVKKMMTNIVLYVRTDENGNVVSCSTRNIGNFDFFSHYHQAHPDCWGNFNPSRRICNTPDEILQLADEAMAVLENINTHSVASRSPRNLPRLNTLLNHLVKDDDDKSNIKEEVKKDILRESGGSVLSDILDDDMWNTTVPF
jgi:hypothetical protein